MEIDFDTCKAEVLKLMDEASVMVLATSHENRVSARSMSCVHDQLTVLFQTGRSSGKVKQMEQNPNVALCAGSLQIEGIAKIRGHPFEPQNADFVELYKKQHPGPFETYSNLEDEVVIEVEPRLITTWKYEKDGPYLYFLDVPENIARREKVDLEDSSEEKEKPNKK